MNWMTRAAGCVLVVAAASCATVPPPGPGTVRSPLPDRPAPAAAAPAGRKTPSSPMPGVEVGTTASGGRITSTGPATPAVVDSLPSPDALEVLASIPEPLGARAESSPSPGSEVGGAATVSDSAAVPVPAPTSSLGAPGTREATADSLAAHAAAQRADTSAAAPAVSGSAAPDSCWRVQLASTPDAERATSLRDAAQSQLVVAVAIEVIDGVYKVRTRDCSGAIPADQLRQRAVATGFEGAFRFRNPRR